MKKIGMLFAVVVIFFSTGSAFGKMPAFEADNYPELAGGINRLKSIEVIESNGKRTFDKASLETRNYIRVLHLKGSPFEMGYQHGTLLKKEITEILKKRTKIESYFRGSKKKRTLRYIRDAESIIPSEFSEEIKGMAAAVNIDYDYMLASTLTWELHKTGCTVLAANQDATANGNIIYSRSMENSPKTHSYIEIMVIFYEPDHGNSFFSVNGPGGIGVYSGMNEKQITIDDVMMIGPKEDFRRDGIPLTFFRRMIVQYANRMEDVQQFIESHVPSSPNNITITDGKTNEMRVYEVAGNKYAMRSPDKGILCSRPHPVALDLEMKFRYEDSYDIYNYAVDYMKKEYGAINVDKLIQFMRSDTMSDRKRRILQYIVIMAPNEFDFWIAAQKRDNKQASNNEFVKFNLLEELKK